MRHDHLDDAATDHRGGRQPLLLPEFDGSDAAVDALQDRLDDGVALRLAAARTSEELAAAALAAATVRDHRPLIVEILQEEHATGTREVGFFSPDGTYIGVVPPLLACSAHDDLEAWPCAVIRSLGEDQPASPPSSASRATPGPA